MESFSYATAPNGKTRLVPRALYHRSDCVGSAEIIANKPSETGLKTLSNVTLLTLPRRDYLRMVGR